MHLLYTRCSYITPIYIYIGEYEKILVLDFNGTGLREISINGFGSICFISVGHNNKMYAADFDGGFCFTEDDTGNVKIITSPGTRYIMGKLVMDTNGNVYSLDTESNCVYKLSSDHKLNKTITDSNFHDIHAICFSKTCSQLFVANNQGKSIIVFNCT